MADGVTRERGPVDGAALVGRLVDRRYLVREGIARGGMATVYRATDTRLDRVVAIKVMHSFLGDDPDFVMRFVREARSAARLSHAGVVAVHDQGQDADLGIVYLVMEHLPGRTLRDVVAQEAPLPPRQALALLEPVLSALAAAHRAGIVHRDVKPENVLIADRGDETGPLRVKVADFGLAKAVSSEAQHTATSGVLIGTVSYLAPELLTDGRADPRADVYAAGIVLAELLTGAKPHRGETPIQIAYHHVHTDVPLPSTQVPGIPAYVDALVARACVRDPEQRPADAGVLLHHLRRVAVALADGVADDPDLVADLLPHAAAVPPVGPADAPAPPTAALPLDPATDEDDRTWHLASHLGGIAPLAPVVGGAARREAPDEGWERAWEHERPGHDQHTPVDPWPPGGSGTPEPPVAIRTTRPRRRRGPMLVVVGVVVLALLAGGAYWLEVGRYTPAPAVLGLSEAEAVDRIEAAGLVAEVGTPRYSETVEEGLVLGTDPRPSDDVVDGGTVTLVLSLGPERYEVPDVRGMTEDEAQDALLAQDLEVGERVERYSDRIPEGAVIGADPARGTSLRPGTVVSLVVSLGPRPVDVPDLVGEDADDAERTYTDLGLDVELVEEFDDEVPAGDVVSQSPGPGELLPGETLTLTVSRGPEQVTIPDGIVGSGVEAARRTLEDLGLVVVEDDSSSVGLGFVTGVDPGEGEVVDVGSEVVIELF